MVSEHKAERRHVPDEIVWQCKVNVNRKCARFLQHVSHVGQIGEMTVSIEDDPSPQLRGSIRNRPESATDTHHRLAGLGIILNTEREHSTPQLHWQSKCAIPVQKIGSQQSIVEQTQAHAAALCFKLRTGMVTVTMISLRSAAEF